MNPRTFVPRCLAAAALAAALALTACGGSDGPNTGTVTISHAGGTTQGVAGLQRDARPAATTAAMLPLTINAMHVSFLDAQGKVVHGPVEVQAAPEVTLRDVPLSATTAKVDYLRNGGMATHTDDEPLVWRDRVAQASPQPAAAPASKSRWTSSVENGVASLKVRTGSDPNAPAADFLMRGVAYSPAPIGFSNKNGPGFGDLFWDTPGGFLDFERVWKRDMENIRGLGFNTLRTYSLIANFINNDGSIPTREQINAPGSLLVRQHQKFLDEAWNNGHNPLYVIVGIPMPADIYVLSNFNDPANREKIRYWDENFTATVQQMKDHPAVIGFTIFNEIGGTGDFSGSGANPTHYWSQVKKYSERAKTTAPDKLVGWAFNDDAGFANNTIEYRKQYAQSIDFYGVNAFQAQQLNTTLDPWVASAQGTAARPVILTEFGLPATGRRDESVIKPYVEPGLTTARNTIGARQNISPSALVVPSTDPGFLALTFSTEAGVLSIYADDSTIAKTAAAVGPLIDVAFKTPIVAGLVYFEWSDEWWKQDSYANFLSPAPGGGFLSFNLVNQRDDRQEGTGATRIGFPNGYWDEEGFGLNAIALDGRAANQVYTDNLGGKGGNVQVDRLTPRTELLNTVTGAFRNAEATRRSALGNR